MSLVGSEIVTALENCGGSNSDVSPERTGADYPDAHNASDGDLDTHAPLTPPRPFESWFVNVETSNISANALAAQLSRTSRSILGTATVATDDFMSAKQQLMNASSFSRNSSFSADDDDDNHQFGTDVLNTSFKFPTEHDTPYRTPKNNMSSLSNQHVDAAEHFYGNVKGVWGWGKDHVPVAGFFMGVSENVANKVVGVVGTNLGEIDHHVLHNLHNLDDRILNPAIHAVVATILGAVQKTEQLFKPMILAVLQPFGLIDGVKTPSLKKDVPGPPEYTGKKMAYVS